MDVRVSVAPARASANSSCADDEPTHKRSSIAAEASVASARAATLALRRQLLPRGAETPQPLQPRSTDATASEST